MNVEDAENCLLQWPLVPTLRNLGLKTEEGRYAGLSEDEKEIYRRELIEKLHACNACYAGCFPFDGPSGEANAVAAKEHDAPKARERQRIARHKTRHETSSSLPIGEKGAEVVCGA